jgi:hypothetical protein
MLKKMTHFNQIKKPRYFLLYLIALLPFLFGIAYMIGFNGKAYANIAIDQQTASNGSSSWSHTVGTNPNTILLVEGSGTISSVSYNGTALTKFDGHTNSGATVSIWYLKNPPTGTHTVAVSGGSSGGSISLSGVDLTNTFGPTGNYSNGSNVTLQGAGSVSLLGITTAGQFILDGVSIVRQSGSGPSAITPGSGQTLAWKTALSGSSTKIATSGLTSTSWGMTSPNGTYSWSGIVAGINPAPIVPTATPIPTAVPTPTTAPTPTAVPTPTSAPIQGNIVNLNFGISNASPWMQVVCGDMRVDTGVTNLLPAGQTTITTNSSCASPGIVYTGDTAATFGQGQASSTNQVVGGSTYPEVYTPPGSEGIFSAYAYLAAKATGSTGGIINLATICTLSNCTLPANLPHGVYEANGDVTLNGYTFSANQNYVFLINGNLTLNGNVLTPAGTNSSTLFSVAGNIIVPATVGSAAGVTTANLSGIFSTDKSFIMQSAGNCNDLRLNLEGSLIVNAGLAGGSLQNNRDLCGGDATAPTLELTQRLDFVLNLPDFVKDQSITSAEVAP